MTVPPNVMGLQGGRGANTVPIPHRRRHRPLSVGGGSSMDGVFFGTGVPIRRALTETAISFASAVTIHNYDIPTEYSAVAAVWYTRREMKAFRRDAAKELRRNLPPTSLKKQKWIRTQSSQSLSQYLDETQHGTMSRDKSHSDLRRFVEDIAGGAEGGEEVCPMADSVAQWIRTRSAGSLSPRDANHVDDRHNSVDDHAGPTAPKNLRNALVVASHDLILLGMSRTLKKWSPHIRVATATRGKEALDLVRDDRDNRPFDFVAVDERLARCVVSAKEGIATGDELLRKLSQDRDGDLGGSSSSSRRCVLVGLYASSSTSAPEGVDLAWKKKAFMSGDDRLCLELMETVEKLRK